MARNGQTKKPSVTFSAAPRKLPSLFVDVTPIFPGLVNALLDALFLLFREQPRKLNARIAGLNDGSFVMDDQETPCVEAL